MFTFSVPMPGKHLILDGLDGSLDRLKQPKSACELTGGHNPAVDIVGGSDLFGVNNQVDELISVHSALVVLVCIFPEQLELVLGYWKLY